MIPVFALVKSQGDLFSFEIHSSRRGVGFVFCGRRQRLLRSTIHALYPGAVIRPQSEGLVFRGGEYVCGGVMDVTNPVMEIRRMDEFGYDPLSHLVESLLEAGRDEKVVVQFLFRQAPLRMVE